jgi:hypothetical protein
MVASTLASLRPGGPGASRCTALQLAGASRAIARLVQAHVRDVRRPDAVRLAADVAAAQLQLGSIFARASSKADCLSATASSTIEASLAQAALRFRDLLSQSCGDGVVQGSEACDGAACATSDPIEPTGCSAAGTSNECQCCADTTPCYVRGNGTVNPVEVPCCSGVCNIPGPEAGPNVEVFCTPEPPVPCPCWTTASLDANLPPSFFTANGRGGLTCTQPGAIALISAVDTCTIMAPGAPPTTYTLPRGGAVVFGPGSCAVFDDADPGNTGHCNFGPRVIQSGLTQAESDSCIAALQASQSYQTCP